MIFYIWTGTTQELVELDRYIDKIHKTKKFTIEHSKNNIVFYKQILTVNCTKHLLNQNTARVAYYTINFLELDKFAKTTNNFERE